MNNQSSLQAEIIKLKKQRNALILAHNYQNDEVQEIADYIGDSFALSRLAAKTPHPVIVLCGVHFMAESAAILAPGKTVLLPEPDAGCPLAETAEPETVRSWKKKYPQAAIVAYINSSAAVKAESDICCTSLNAVQIVRSLESKEIIFLPDQNLGSYVAAQIPEKTVHLWPGNCPIHHKVTADEVTRLKSLHPGAEALIHPECRPEVLALADFIGSTTQIIERVEKAKASRFIIGTEKGVLHILRKKYPDKQFFLLSPELECADMKKVTLHKIFCALRDMKPVISVPEPIRSRAKLALERMIAFSSQPS